MSKSARAPRACHACLQQSLSLQCLNNYEDFYAHQNYGEPRPWGIAPTALQLALARGHRWLAMLESGKVSSLREIAAQEGVDNSYVSRMMNLTVLAPDIVEAILDDASPDHLTLFDIAVDPPALWEGQRMLMITI